MNSGDVVKILRDNESKYKILVSVIVPVYNVRPFLSEALESVINQSYHNLEIIVVDDGSTDGSRNICDEFANKDDRIRVIHQRNRGLSAARNVGLDALSGDLVVFLDPDDAYHPNYIDDMIYIMNRDNADIVVCKYTSRYSTEKMDCSDSSTVYPIISPGTYNKKEALQKLVDNTLNVNVWNKLYKRELWNSIRFPEGHVYEDNLVAFQIYSQCNIICVLNKILYFHRKRSGSITDTQSLTNIQDMLLAHYNCIMFIESNTPEVFTEEQLEYSRKLWITLMISTFIKSLNKTLNGWIQFRRGLRKQIINVGKEKYIGHIEIRIKAVYWMIYWCPWILKIFYPFYRPIRKFIWNVIRIATRT